MFVWLRKKFSSGEVDKQSNLQISLKKHYHNDTPDIILHQSDIESQLMQKLTMEIAKRGNENEAVASTKQGGDMRRQRLNMFSSSTLKSVSYKGDDTTPKIDTNDDASNILPAIEEIYQYEKKLQKLVEENECKRETKVQQKHSVMDILTKLQDDEIKEIFKRKFKEQLKKQKSNNCLDENTVNVATEVAESNEIESQFGEKPPDSSTRIWKGVQLKESNSREYSTSFGRITLRDSDLPKYVRETTDTSLDLTTRKASILSEQVNKMKYGMEKLNSVLNSNYAEKYKKDIDFLIANIAPHIQKWEKEKEVQKTKLMDIPEVPNTVP